VHYFWNHRGPRAEGEQVRCSDKGCDCGGVVLSYNEAYLYVSEKAAAFRMRTPSYDAVRQELAKQQSGGVATKVRATDWTGIIVCEKSAKERKLDLHVARADAAHWWDTGEMPLRATPLAEKKLHDGPQTQKVMRRWWEFWVDDPISRTEFVYVFTGTSAPKGDKAEYTSSAGTHSAWTTGTVYLAGLAFPFAKWPKKCRFGGAYDSKPEKDFTESYQDGLRSLAWNAYQGLLLRENMERMKQGKASVSMRGKHDYEIDVVRCEGNRTDVVVIRRK